MAQQNFKKQTQRKINNNLPSQEEDPKKRPRFNVYWIYGLIFASIVVYNLYRNVNNAGIETDQIKFTDMVKHGDVDLVKTIRNKKLVRIFLNHDSLVKKSDLY